MSGTPIENRLSEYWSIFDLIYKGYMGNLENNEKVLIFTQFREMGKILQQMIRDRFQNDAREKKELADLAVSAGEKWVGELSNSDLKALFSIT